MQLVATELRAGNIILFNGQLHRVMSVVHVTPGHWRGMVQCKLRNLKSGDQTEHRFRSEDRVEKASLDTVEMQYMYSDPSGHHFMNTETYEQVTLTDEALGDALGYLLPEAVISVDFYEGNPIGIELPTTVVLTVVDTGNKPAKLETGITVNVPMYIETGTKIIVDTRTGEYSSRA